MVCLQSRFDPLGFRPCFLVKVSLPVGWVQTVANPRETLSSVWPMLFTFSLYSPCLQPLLYVQPGCSVRGILLDNSNSLHKVHKIKNLFILLKMKHFFAYIIVILQWFLVVVFEPEGRFVGQSSLHIFNLKILPSPLFPLLPINTQK